VPRTVVALVSADDFVAVVRVYADRVNDMLRRNGIDAAAAVEVSQTAVLDLLDALRDSPETVVDLAGWWFARAIALTVTDEEDAAAADLSEETVSVLAGSTGEAGVRDAIAHLPDAERAAVVLRDGYDLPPQAVAVAMRRQPATTAGLTAQGRLRLVEAYDGRLAPDLSGHVGNTTVDVVSLSELAEGTLDGPRAMSLRRHVGSCPACEDVLEALTKARRLVSSLPIIALDDDALDGLLDTVGARAVAQLPSHEAVLQSIEDDVEPCPAISPIAAIVVLVLALALGIAVAVTSELRHSPRLPPAPQTSSSAAATSGSS
jgi:DNA-directed RNA polymerase specialized sigma24 family protein